MYIYILFSGSYVHCLFKRGSWIDTFRLRCLGSFYQEEKREPEKITWAAPFRRNTWPRPGARPVRPFLRMKKKKREHPPPGGGAIWQTSILRDGEIWGQPHYYLWKIPFYLKGWDGFEGCERFIKIVWNPLDGSGKDRWVALFLRACLYLGNSLSAPLQVAPWSVFVTTSPQAVVEEKSTVLGMFHLFKLHPCGTSHRRFPIWLFGTPQRGECWTLRPLPQKECRKKLFLAMKFLQGKGRNERYV